MTMKRSSLRGSDLAWAPKADCTDFMVRVNRCGPILPPLVGSLVHGVPVPFFSLSEETVEAERPRLPAWPPQTSALLFFSGRGGESLLETSCYSLFILYRPLTKITIDPWSFCRFTATSTNAFCFPCSDCLWNCFVITISSVPTNSSSCWKQQCYDGSQCFSVAIATGARKPRVTATLQEPSRLHLSSPSPSFRNLN